jgi:hypothetical protein
VRPDCVSVSTVVVTRTQDVSQSVTYFLQSPHLTVKASPTCTRKRNFQPIPPFDHYPAHTIASSKSRKRLAGHVARMRAKMNPYRTLVGKPEGKGPLGIPRRRWMILKWILGWGGMDCVALTQDRDQRTRQWAFGFHKMPGSSWEAAQLAASQEGSAPWS